LKRLNTTRWRDFSKSFEFRPHMKIRVKTIYPFAQFLFEKAETAGNHGQQDDFMEWGNRQIASGLGQRDEIDLPVQFHSVWREFMRTDHYTLDDVVMETSQWADRSKRSFDLSSPSSTKSMTPLEVYETLIAALDKLRSEGKLTPEQYDAQKDGLDRAYGQTTKQPIMKSASFLTQFENLTGTTKGVFDRLELSRRSGDFNQVRRASLSAMAMARGVDPVAAILADPEKAEIIKALARRITTNHREPGIPHGMEKAFTVGVAPGDSGLGTGLVIAKDVSEYILYASYDYSAYKFAAAVRVLRGITMGYAKITQPASAVFITPSAQGNTQLPADTSISGAQVTELSNTIACLVEVSMELVQDGKVTFEEALLRAMIEGHGRAVDYALFQGNGVNDQTNGAQVGIFQNPNVASSMAVANSIAGLTRADFIGVIAAVAPSALTRNPRWTISPAFLPKLMMLRDGQGPKYLLKTPAETEGEFELVGFPVTWAIQAPGIDAPGQKIASFGAPEGYLVALHEDIEIMASDVSQIAKNVRQVRLINRGRIDARETTWFATLQLSIP